MLSEHGVGTGRQDSMACRTVMGIFYVLCILKIMCSRICAFIRDLIAMLKKADYIT